jgi:hypothetical protein
VVDRGLVWVASFGADKVSAFLVRSPRKIRSTVRVWYDPVDVAVLHRSLWVLHGTTSSLAQDLRSGRVVGKRIKLGGDLQAFSAGWGPLLGRPLQEPLRSGRRPAPPA